MHCMKRPRRDGEYSIQLTAEPFKTLTFSVIQKDKSEGAAVSQILMKKWASCSFENEPLCGRVRMGFQSSHPNTHIATYVLGNVLSP